MYRNKTKMGILTAVFLPIFVGCAYVAAMMVFYIFLVVTQQIYTIPEMFGMSCMMGVVFAMVAFLAFKKLRKVFCAGKMGRFFEQDRDGLVSIEELAAHMKMKQHKCFAMFLDCVGSNLLIKCTVFPEDPTYLLLENGKETLAEKFAVKHCARCGAPGTLRIGFENTCRYCGSKDAFR